MCHVRGAKCEVPRTWHFARSWHFEGAFEERGWFNVETQDFASLQTHQKPHI